ncbi:MAG: lipoyl(octanoyl) transferase LipB [Candidatus Eisenbacteria bacterium]
MRRERDEARPLWVVSFDAPQRYRPMWELQRTLHRARLEGRVPDLLLLLEHEAVVTLGKNARHENLLLSEAMFAARGVELVEVDRGGDVTYHGPGQLVGYWIFDLRAWRQDVHRYLRAIEECVIATAAEFGVAAGRSPGATGVWVEPQGVRGAEVDPARAAKLAAMGLHLSHWVSTHGLALNLTTDLGAFEWIVPCGLRGRAVTSLERLLGRSPDRARVEQVLVRAVEAEFDRRAEWIDEATLRARLACANEEVARTDALVEGWNQACPI